MKNICSLILGLTSRSSRAVPGRMNCSCCQTQTLTSFIHSITGSGFRQSRIFNLHLQKLKVGFRPLNTSTSRKSPPTVSRLDPPDTSNTFTSPDDTYLPFDGAAPPSGSPNAKEPILPYPFTPPPAPPPLRARACQDSTREVWVQAQQECLNDPEIRLEEPSNYPHPGVTPDGPSSLASGEDLNLRHEQSQSVQDKPALSSAPSGARKWMDRKDNQSTGGDILRHREFSNHTSKSLFAARKNSQTNERKSFTTRPANRLTESKALRQGHLRQDSEKPWSDREPWQAHKASLKAKFGSEGWNPRKKLSPDAMEGVRALHAQYPDQFTTAILANEFKVSPEAIRRILKSNWRPNPGDDESRRQRWDKRGEKMWSQLVEQGIHPPKKWREMGVGGGPRRRAQDRSFGPQERDNAYSDEALRIERNDGPAWLNSFEERLA